MFPKRYPVVTVVIALIASSVTAQESRGTKIDNKAVNEIQVVIDAQRDAWNRGDIAGYMDGYERSEKITFISGDTVTRGWQTVHDRYKKNYDSREKMGTLTFSDIEKFPLSKDTYMVLGRWHLQRANDQPQGRFTLIFKRTKQGWRIIHDHTS